jgi:4'-phosphopantetheinyl transferase
MIPKTSPNHRWPPPPSNPQLTETDVHVWRAALDQSQQRVEQLAALLSEDEKARAHRFHFERDKRRFTVGRGVLRLILGKYLQVDPDQLQFGYGPQGKPSLIKHHLQFNVSHSHELALYAVTLAHDVGVDIEHLRSMPDYEQIATRFFSTNEQRALLSLPPHQQEKAFFTCWTRKEAYIKAIGHGLMMPLDQFDVSLAPNQPAALLEIRAEMQEVSDWSLRALHPTPGYVAALVVASRNLKLSCWQWLA